MNKEIHCMILLLISHWIFILIYSNLIIDVFDLCLIFNAYGNDDKGHIDLI